MKTSPLNYFVHQSILVKNYIQITFYDTLKGTFYTLELLISYLFIKLYNVLTCIPVAPFGKYPSGLDRYAVPAISRRIHGVLLATKFSLSLPIAR